MQELETGDCGT